MTTHRTGKNDYNAICDVCGWQVKASELRQRWDGFMVCKDDWEPRNILDFYKTRQDAHKLPFTRPDDADTELSWTPTYSTLVGNNSRKGFYSVDNNNVVTYRLIVTPTRGNLSSTATTLSLPVGTVSQDRGGSVLLSNGVRLTAPTAGASISVPAFAIQSDPLVILTITGSYVKA